MRHRGEIQREQNLPEVMVRCQRTAALNSSRHSKEITKAKLIRKRVPMLQKISIQISAELSRVPGLSLSAQT
jgi:hypothetical protein